jgi:hypothetical protein
MKPGGYIAPILSDPGFGGTGSLLRWQITGRRMMFGAQRTFQFLEAFFQKLSVGFGLFQVGKIT